MAYTIRIITRDVDMVLDLFSRIDTCEYEDNTRAFCTQICFIDGVRKPILEAHKGIRNFKDLKNVLLGSKYFFKLEVDNGQRLSPEEFLSLLEEDTVSNKYLYASDTNLQYRYKIIDCKTALDYNKETGIYIDDYGYQWINTRID